MNKKKLIAAMICLVLVITAALPGTLAVSVDAAASDGSIAVATPDATQTPDEAAPQSETEQPAEPETPAETKTCTCDPAPAEGEAHKEGCPLYVAPFVHLEGCADDCTAEDCKCTCHLMKKIMECKTLGEIKVIIAETPEEELNALSEEQIAKIEVKIKELEPVPAPAVTVKAADSIVESEVFAPTVNYTNVAPFGEPVGCGQ